MNSNKIGKYKRVKEHYTWKKAAEAHLKIYKDALNL